MVEQFNLFWDAYAKKSGKGSAESVWRRMKPANRLLAIEAAKQHAAIWATAPPDRFHYRPSAGPWLNKGRWGDDLDEVRLAATTRKGGVSATASGGVPASELARARRAREEEPL